MAWHLCGLYQPRLPGEEFPEIAAARPSEELNHAVLRLAFGAGDFRHQVED